MMTHTPFSTRLLRGLSATLILLAAFPPLTAHGQQSQAYFELRPHCENEEMEQQFGGPIPPIEGIMTLTDGRCASFSAADPQNYQTGPLKKDDTLDVDLVIRNTNGSAVRSAKAWIAYDPTILEGIDVTLHPSFPIPTPGENIFSKEQGYIVIGATAAQETAKQTVVVARIRMRVLSTSVASTVLSFSTDERTGAMRRTNGEDTNILTAKQPSLIIRFDSGGAAASSAPSSSPTESSAPASSTATSVSSASSASSVSSLSSISSVAPVSSVSSAPANGIFTMLQVQNLRVTTQGSTVYAAWDPLGSAELAGYTLYYGGVSGRYIHRRGVPLPDTSVSIRGLPEGSLQYFAVRGVTTDGRETEFSQEVAVTVGDATTATSLLTANAIAPGTPHTGGNVAGSTGSSTLLSILVLLSAVIGTLFAFRRQLIVRT